MATIITKTIGQDGWQDFSTIQQATDAITTSDVANTADLVAADKAVVFEIYAGTYSESVSMDEGLTCDATRNVTYKPASGSEHGGSRDAGVRVTSFDVRDSFTTIKGVVLDTAVTNGTPEGIIFDSCIAGPLPGAGGQSSIILQNGGTATNPQTVRNCVFVGLHQGIWCFANSTGTEHYLLENNTAEIFFATARANNAAGTCSVEVNNNVCLGLVYGGAAKSDFRQSGSGLKLITGEGNIGTATTGNVFPSAIRANSQIWTATSATTAASTGSQVIYEDTNYSLVNVSGNDAVGVCDGTTAPATDINGEDRIRGKKVSDASYIYTFDAYADPGAFTTELVEIVKTIDAAGNGDYTTFDAAASAYPALSTSNNLSKRNESVVFEAKAGNYTTTNSNGVFLYDPTMTADSIRAVVFRAALGSEHNGDASAGVIVDVDPGTTSYYVFHINTNMGFFRLEGLNVRAKAGVSNCIGSNGALNVIADNCLLHTESVGARAIQVTKSAGKPGMPATAKNCIITGGRGVQLGQAGNDRWVNFKLVNNTITNSLNNNESAINILAQATASVFNAEVQNNACLSPRAYGENLGGYATVTGTSNVGGATEAFPVALQAGSQTWTFSTSATAPSTGSQVIYDDTTYKLLNLSGNDAVGVGDGAVAPTTDILGNARIRGAANEYADPGAFTTDLITATRTIGKGGWQDFTTFTAAEAEADTIANELLGGSRLNLAERNGKIVYEAYAATYQESTRVQFDDGITAGPGNGVTYQAASGSEHLGVSGEGVYLVRPSDSNNINCFIENDYFTFDGLSVYNQQNNARPITLQGAVNGVTIKNCLVHADISNGICVQTSTRSAGSIAPNVFENNVFRWQGNYGLYLAQAQGSETGPGKAVVNNNTFQPSWVGGVCLGFADTGSYLDVSANNNLLLAGLSMYVLGSVRITGQGNFDVQVTQSGPYAPLPGNIRGSAAPITAVTETSAISTGSQAVIDADTLALVNVSGNDIVGLGSGSAISVPANDILGNSRIRGASNEYADPGAFSTDLITATKIIDINEGFPYDYSNIKDGHDDQSNITRSLLGGTRLNLAQRNGNLVYEVRSGRYGLQTTDLPSYWNVEPLLITSPGRSVTIRPEIGSEHNGSFSEGVLLRETTGNMTYFSAPFMEINGLVFMSPDSGGGYYGPAADGEGVKFKNCLVDWSNTQRDCLKIGISTVEHPVIVENCLLKTDSTFSFRRALVIAPNSNSKIKNCTLIHTLNSGVIGVENLAEAATTNVELTNCSLISTQGVSFFGDATFTGSNNICGPTDPLPASTLAEDQTWTFSTSATAPSTGAQLIYDDTTYKLLNVSGNDAVGVGTGTGAPTTDILGNSRIRGADNEYADPGAFTTDLITATKIIDVNRGSGYDYLGFVEAMSDLDEVAYELLGGTRENLAQRNGSIVFEAKAGTYNENFNFFNQSLTCDATRNIAWINAEGSEHGGQFESGVNIIGYAWLRTPFAVLDGISVSPSSGGAILIAEDLEGAVLRNLMVYSPDNNAVKLAIGGSDSFPCVVENCVIKSDSTSYRPFDIRSQDAGVDSHWSVVNNTIIAGVNRQGFIVGISSSDNLYLELTNNIVIGDQSYYANPGPTVILTGGDNVGPNGSYPLPSGLQAEGQTWTFSTSATAPSTGNQVIYTSATGALLNVSGNDAIGVGDGTKAPTTDINGNDRIRGLNDEYTDPGAFTSEKNTILKRVANLGLGESDAYYDYGCLADIQNRFRPDIEDYLGDNRSNIAQRNAELVYEFHKGEYLPGNNANKLIQFTVSPVMGPTNRVILRPDAESHHNGDGDQGVIFSPDNYSTLVNVKANNPASIAFVDFEGFVIKNSDDTRTGCFLYNAYKFGDITTYCGGKLSNILCLQDTTNMGVGDRAFVRGSVIDGAGSQKYPIEVENCVIQHSQAPYLIETLSNPAEKTTFVRFNNNTIKSKAGVYIADYQKRNNAPLLDLEFNNNVFIPWDGYSNSHFVGINADPSSLDLYNSATSIKGSNNFIYSEVTTSSNAGNGTIVERFPMGSFMRGSVYPVNYTTDITSTSADTFIYDADNLSPINTSGNALIGLGDVSLAVSSDIIGVDRIRSGLGTQYADPGAFTSDIRTISKTIDSTGNGDYTTIFASEAALALSIPNPLSTNLVLRNEEIVFNTIPGQTITETSHISVTGVPPSGPKNRIIWRCPDPTNRTLVDSTSTIGVFILKVPYIKIENLNFRTEKYAVSFSADSGSDVVGCLIKNCVIDAYGTLAGLKATKSTSNSVGTREEPNVVENVVTKGLAAISTYWPTNPEHAGTAAAILFRNCTHMDSTGAGITQNNAWNWEAASIRGHDYSIMEIHNCLNLASGGFDSPGVTEGSGNVGNSSTGNNSFSGKGVGINLNPTTNTSPGVGDWSIYTSATGELVNVSANDAVGVGIGTEAPTTDILGNSRIRGASNEYADPGAFSVDNITYTRTIGLGGSASGFDYGNFTDAEAEVTIIPYAENLAQRNLAIVFEADKGYYDENPYAFFPVATILDNTRTVTFKNAPEARHSGVAEQGAGVRTFSTQQDFVVFDGLVLGSQPSGATSTAIAGNAIGVTYKNCLFLPTTFNKVLDAGSAGSVEHPTIIENCIFRGNPSAGSQRMINLEAYGSDVHTEVVNNTAVLEGRMFVYFGGPDNKSLKATNNVFNGTGFVNPGSTTTLLGSNNVGVTSIPVTLQAEGQTWTFTTDTTASSTGNQVIYTSATGALVNVSGNDAVGVGDGTQAPTTDILGNSRIRGANNEYTDPGAFSTEKVTFTKKIGPYREYTTFTDAEADVVAISTNGNLAERNEAIVFEADAGTYSENFTISNSLTCDPTRNVTYQSAAGGQAVVGNAAPSAVIKITEGAFTALRSLKIASTGTSTSTRGIEVFPSSGSTCEGCLFDSLTIENPTNTNFGAFELQLESTAAAGGVGSATNPTVIKNCVELGAGNGLGIVGGKTDEIHVKVVNCTFAGSSFSTFSLQTANDITIDAVNNINLGHQWDWRISNMTGAVTATGSGNVGGSDNPFPAALQAESQTWTFTTDTTAAPTGNQVVYEAATGKMLAVSGNDAIGIGNLSAAPTTDINGTSRLRGVGTQYVDPGAFTSDVNTITKTIGIGGAASGFDFGGFLEAEAAVDTTAVTYDNNLAEKNIAIVFEADAGTYAETVAFQSSLTTDATRQVTYQPAAGSEHGGVPSTGVVLQSTTGITARDDHMTLRGICYLQTATGGATSNGIGLLFDQIIYEYAAGVQYGTFMECTSALFPSRWQNSVLLAQGVSGGDRRGFIASHADINGHVEFVNCTVVAEDPALAGFWTQTFGTGTCQFHLVNCLRLGSSTGKAFNNSGTGTTSTGSNNVGGATNPFPAAIQAEGQTWTITTDTAQPSTGNQVIYTSATGALVNVSGNDAIGVGTGSAINVPANDILGKSRLRGLSNEYVDPGAFTTDIETTTLTANPGTLSAIIDNLTPYITTTNIAKRNESIVIELEKADYPEITHRNLENIIGDSVRNITIKPEEGAHHKGIRGAGIRLISATAGYDNIFFVDVSGLTLEGVEIYKPSGDIGRHGIVVRDSEGVRFKDVIFNDLEVSSHTQSMMGSTYRNGFLSPISFKNCLGFCRSLNFYFQSAGPLPGGKYELINCTLSSVSNTVPVIKADSTQADGTIEINLVNNLILSPHRNININKTNGGDGFVYGRNNFGPDTPNYQLPTAVRGSIYPIFPTFDYTPVPSSPAAVYRPGTLQLLDIPDNDVLQLGVGTDDPLVPLQGIGEDSRSTSSCNPGCWEDDYELVDLRINTFDGSTGIVDPYFGPPTDIANAVLPDATVPVFIVIGDSTAQGFSVEINDARSYREATDYWPTNAFDGSAYGYFWNKYMTTPDNGVTWTRDISYISPDTSGDAFLPINPRMGGIGVGTFTYSDPLPVSTVPAGNCSPLWDFSLAISGIFRNSAGETLTPHFIFLASTGSRLGSNGPTFLGNDEYNFSPSGYLFNTLNQSYIKPAVDHLMNNGKHPLLVGTLIMAGGTEANISYNPTPDGSKVSTSGAATYVNFLSATEAAAKVSGRAPWIAYEVWDSVSSDYPEVYSKFMQKALYGLKDISINRRINMQNLERDKGTTAQNTDIHFVQYKYPDYGRQFAGAYRALLTWRRSPIFGRTLSEIFNE